MTTTLVTRNINNIQFQNFQIDYLLVDAPDISHAINITNQTLLYNHKGDKINDNFILIGNDNGIAINTNFDKVNSNLINMTKFYVDGNIKIDGTVFCQNLSFSNSNIFDINSNISNFFHNYNQIHNPFTNINSDNYNTQHKINIANVHASQFNKNYLNINRISNNINRLQFSIKNDHNSSTSEDNSYNRIRSSIDIGILGIEEYSPAIIHTTLNKQLEFHISKRKSNIQKYYDYNNDDYKPSMIIDTSNCIHINDNNFNGNISNIKLNVNGSAYINQIYTGNNFCNLDHIYLKKNQNSLDPKWMQEGTFNGNYTFNNDLNISNLLTTNKLDSSNIISHNINTTKIGVTNKITANSIDINSLSLNGSNININNSLKTFVIDYKYSNIYTTVNNFKNYIYNSNIIKNKIKFKLMSNGYIINTDLHGIINKNSNIYDQYNFLQYKYNFFDIQSNLNMYFENNGIHTYYDHLNSNFDFSNISLNIFTHNNVSNIIENNIIYYENSDLISDIRNYLSNNQNNFNYYSDSKYYRSDINNFYIFNNADNFASNICMYNQPYSIKELKEIYQNFIELGITALNNIIQIYEDEYSTIQLTNFNSEITNYILYSNIDINTYFESNYNISNIDINQIKVELYSLLNSNIILYNDEYIKNIFNSNGYNLNKLIDNNRRNNDINDINIYSSNIYNINYITSNIHDFLIIRQHNINIRSDYNACNINLLLTNVIDNIDFNNSINYDIKYRLYLSILSSYTTIENDNMNDAILSYTIDHKPNYSGDQVTFNYKMSIGDDIDQSDKTHRLVIKDENKEQIKFINNNHYGYIGHKQNNANIDFIISTKHVTNEDNIIFKPGNKNTLYLKADLGRVGINTSNPLHKLDVIGSIRFTDKLYTSYLDRPNCPIINLIEHDNKIKIKNNNTNIIDFENIKQFNLDQSEIKVRNIKIKDTVSHDYNNLVAIKKNENYMYINEPANLTIGHSSITDRGQINYPINDAAMHIKNSFKGANNNTIIRLFKTDTLGHQDTINATCIYTGLEFTNISSYNPQIGYSNYEGWYIHNSYNDEFKIGYKNNSNIKDDFIELNNNKIIINKNLDVYGNINIRNGCNIYLDISGDIKMNNISITSNLDFNSVNRYYSDRNCNLISFQTNQRDIAIIAHAEYSIIDEDGSFIIGNKDLNYLELLSEELNDENLFDAKCIILQNKSDLQSFNHLKPTLDLRSIYTNIIELPKSYLRLSLYQYNNTSRTVISHDKFDIKFEKNDDDSLDLKFKFNENVFFKFYNNSDINYFNLGKCIDETTDKPLLHLEDKNSTLLYLKNTDDNNHKILLNDWEIIANNHNFYIGSNIFNINRNNDNISINNYNNNNYTFNIQNTNNNYEGILNIKNTLSNSNSNINYIRLENLDSIFDIRTTSNSFDIYNNDANIFKLNNNGTLIIQNLEVTDLTIKGNVNYSNIISELNDSISLQLFDQLIHKNNNFYLRTYEDDATQLNYTIYLNSRNNNQDYDESFRPSVVIDNYYNHERTLVLRTANYSSNFIIFNNSNIQNSIGFEEDKFIVKNGNNTIFEISENTDINVNNDLIVGNFIIHNNGIIENLNSNNIITHFIKKIHSSDYKKDDLIIFEKKYKNIEKNQIARISYIEYYSNITLDFNNLVNLDPQTDYYYNNNNYIGNKVLNINEIEEYTHKFEKVLDINKDNIIVHKYLNVIGGSSIGSDRRIKTDIINIENSLEKINKLQGVLYTNKFTKNRHAGLIAQDVRKIIPEVVVEDDENILGIEYGNMIGFIVESIKELTFEIKNMKSKLNL